MLDALRLFVPVVPPIQELVIYCLGAKYVFSGATERGSLSRERKQVGCSFPKECTTINDSSSPDGGATASWARLVPDTLALSTFKKWDSDNSNIAKILTVPCRDEEYGHSSRMKMWSNESGRRRTERSTHSDDTVVKCGRGGATNGKRNNRCLPEAVTGSGSWIHRGIKTCTNLQS